MDIELCPNCKEKREEGYEICWNCQYNFVSKSFTNEINVFDKTTEDIELISKSQANDLLFDVNKIKIAGTALKDIASNIYYQIAVSLIFGLLTFLEPLFAIIGIIINLILLFYIISLFQKAGEALSDSIEIKEEAKI